MADWNKNSSFPQTRQWQEPLAYEKQLSGDQAKCHEWLPWALAKLKSALQLQNGTITQLFIPIPDVQVTVSTRPNRIRIEAHGGVYVTIPEFLSPTGAYPVNTSPPFQRQKNRNLFKTYGQVESPLVKSEFYAAGHGHRAGPGPGVGGGQYWYNGKQAVSYKFSTVYVRGKFCNLGLTIFCAALTPLKVLGANIDEKEVLVVWIRTGATSSVRYLRMTDHPTLTGQFTVFLLIQTNVPAILVLGNEINGVSAQFNKAASLIVFQVFDLLSRLSPASYNTGRIYKIDLIIHHFFVSSSLTLLKQCVRAGVTQTAVSSQTLTAEEPFQIFDPHWGSDSAITTTTVTGIVEKGVDLIDGGLDGDIYKYLFTQFAAATSSSVSSRDNSTNAVGGSRENLSAASSGLNSSTESYSVELWMGEIDLITLADNENATLIDTFSINLNYSVQSNVTRVDERIFTQTGPSLASRDVRGNMTTTEGSSGVTSFQLHGFHPATNTILYAISSGTSAETRFDKMDHAMALGVVSENTIHTEVSFDRSWEWELKLYTDDGNNTTLLTRNANDSNSYAETEDMGNELSTIFGWAGVVFKTAQQIPWGTTTSTTLHVRLPYEPWRVSNTNNSAENGKVLYSKLSTAIHPPERVGVAIALAKTNVKSKVIIDPRVTSENSQEWQDLAVSVTAV